MTVANADPPKPINTTDSHSRQVNFFNSCNRGSKIGTTKKAMTICSMSTMAVEEISVVKNFRKGASTAQSSAAIVTNNGPQLYLLDIIKPRKFRACAKKHIFFYPDFTVGSGIKPDHAPLRARGLYHRSPNCTVP